MWGRVSVGLTAALVCAASMAPAGAVGKPAPRPSWLRSAEQIARAQVAAPSAKSSVLAAAVAPPNTVTDPANDVAGAAGGVSPHGDIIGAGFAQTSTTLTFGIKVKAPVNPKTDATWLGGLAFLTWALDTDHDGIPDDFVFLVPDLAGGMLVTETTAAADLVCNGTGAYISTYGYTATFPKSCLRGGLAFQFQAVMAYGLDTSPSPLPLSDVAPDNSFSPTLVVAQAVAASGYWMLGSDGRVYPFGGAVGFPGTVPGAAAMTPRKDGKGYWVVDVFGHVFAHGTAGFHGGSPALLPGEHITTIAATPTGKGYWLFSTLGRAFAFGDARFHGDLSGTHLNGPVIASTATPSGRGYYMIGTDGGIFAFGDAKFHGSTAGIHLNKPIVGMSPTPKGTGYWLVGSDGGVFAFNAPFRGSMGGTTLNKSVDGLVSYGNGYLMAASDGGVFDFSNRPFVGSLANNPPSAPIIGLAAFGS